VSAILLFNTAENETNRSSSKS